MIFFNSIFKINFFYQKKRRRAHQWRHIPPGLIVWSSNQEHISDPFWNLIINVPTIDTICVTQSNAVNQRQARACRGRTCAQPLHWPSQKFKLKCTRTKSSFSLWIHRRVYLELASRGLKPIQAPGLTPLGPSGSGSPGPLGSLTGGKPFLAELTVSWCWVPVLHGDWRHLGAEWPWFRSSPSRCLQTFPGHLAPWSLLPPLCTPQLVSHPEVHTLGTQSPSRAHKRQHTPSSVLTVERHTTVVDGISREFLWKMILRVRHRLLHKDGKPGQMLTRAGVSRPARSAWGTCRVRGSLCWRVFPASITKAPKLLARDSLPWPLPSVKLFICVTGAMSFHCNLRPHSTELVAVRSSCQAFWDTGSHSIASIRTPNILSATQNPRGEMFWEEKRMNEIINTFFLILYKWKQIISFLLNTKNRFPSYMQKNKTAESQCT